MIFFKKELKLLCKPAGERVNTEMVEKKMKCAYYAYGLIYVRICLMRFMLHL